jgi:hypothetical protein
MNRRGFLQTMIGGVAAAAAVRTFPFRVFSFPSGSISLANLSEQAAIDPVTAKLAEELGYQYEIRYSNSNTGKLSCPTVILA